ARRGHADRRLGGAASGTRLLRGRPADRPARAHRAPGRLRHAGRGADRRRRMSPGTGRAVRAAAALRPSRATRTESVHVGVGLAVGLIALRGTAPLAGEGSIGQVAALAVFGGAAVTAMVVLSTLTRRSLPWFGGRHWWRRALDVVGLSLVYGLLGLFLTGALF